MQKNRVILLMLYINFHLYYKYLLYILHNFLIIFKCFFTFFAKNVNFMWYYMLTKVKFNYLCLSFYIIIMSIKERWNRFMENQELKDLLYEIIFGSDTPMGKTFDVILMICIVVSILITIFDSLFTNPWIVDSLVVLEYLLTLFFTFEYLARLYCSPRPRDYAFSFFGIIDTTQF